MDTDCWAYLSRTKNAGIDYYQNLIKQINVKKCLAGICIKLTLIIHRRKGQKYCNFSKYNFVKFCLCNIIKLYLTGGSSGFRFKHGRNGKILILQNLRREKVLKGLEDLEVSEVFLKVKTQK